jgi:NAD(P)-dependent dehydrogenase (short-subunit alcohol dehydrogenase family)
VSDRRVAVVTGGNRGIGREIARRLAAAGLDVIATGRDPAQGKKAAAEVGARYLPLDVTDQASIDALAASLRGGVDVLVNNSGITMQGFDVGVARGTLDVNFFGAMNVTDRLLPLMRAGGRIVMVSSGMGELSSVSSALRRRLLDPALTREELVSLMESFVREVGAGTHAEHGWPSSAYRVSKVGLNALTRILARELASDPRRILVNAVCPGWVRTAMGGPGAPRSPEKGGETPAWLALLPEGGPSGRFFRDQHEIAW